MQQEIIKSALQNPRGVAPLAEHEGNADRAYETGEDLFDRDMPIEELADEDLPVWAR